MATSVVASLQDVWDAWGIRGFMILSLTMQLLLAIVSPLRRKTSNRWVILLIWSAYFLADWAAIFAFGLISNARCKNATSIDQDLLAFWSAFLLIHLGGSDSITAYSLEDNTLWLRHLVGLVAQVLAFLNIFVKTLPSNDLRVPTVLIAIAGAIKYGERTRALYLASIEKLKKSIVKSRGLAKNRNSTSRLIVAQAPQSNTAGSNSEEDTSKERIKTAFHYFQIFKGLVVDMMPDHSEWLESRNCFLNQDSLVTFEILKMELKSLYEVFYTKVLAANSAWGVLIRSLAFYNVLIALILFCLIKKEGIHGADVRITYSLLAGVIVLDSASELQLVTMSNWTSVNPFYMGCQMLGHGLVLFFIVGVAMTCIVACFAALCCKRVAFRQWSETTGALSILGRAFEESCPRKGSRLSDYWRKINVKINDKMGVVVLTELQYERKNKLDMKLWDFVFCHLREKALPTDDADKVRAVYEARGEDTLRNMNLAELRRYVDDMEFENSILVWHCATEICYQVDRNIDGDDNIRKMYSKVLSDYLVYLLIKQPKLMSPVAGVEEIRYRDTCVEAKNIGKKHLVETMDQFCKNILDEHTGTAESDDRTGKGMSVLPDACAVANAMRHIGPTKWDIISKVWVDVLLYAAGHCRADSHVRLLSEGGELITFVWLLMAHFGIIARFPKV